MGRVMIVGLLLGGCSLVASSDQQAELCDNGVDDDFDGRIDCADGDCASDCPNSDIEEPDLLGTCSGGWRSSRDGAHCEPWGIRDWIECNSLQYRPSSSPDCIDIGDDSCELTPEVLLPGTFVVDQAAAPGGDGSVDAPFHRLEDAIDAAEDGDRIVFEGTFTGDRVIEKQLTFQGVCTNRSILSGALTLASYGGSFINLQLVNEGAPVVSIPPPPRELPEGSQVFLEMDGALVRGSVEVEDSMARGRLNVRGSAIKGPVRLSGFFMGAVESTFISSGGEPCIVASGLSNVYLGEVVLEKCGLELDEAQATLSHCLAERLLLEPAVTVDCGATPGFPCSVTVEDSLFRRSEVGSEPMIHIVSGGAQISGSAFVDGEGPAIRVDDGELTLEDSSILQPAVVGGLGAPGVGVEMRGGSAILREVAIEGYGEAALRLSGGSLEASELILRGDPEAAVDGIVAAAGTALTVDEFFFDEPGACGFRLDADLDVSITNGMIETDEAGLCIPAGSYAGSMITDRITQRTGTLVREEPAD